MPVDEMALQDGLQAAPPVRRSFGNLPLELDEFRLVAAPSSPR